MGRVVDSIKIKGDIIMPADPFQSLITYEYTSREGTPYKLELVLGHQSDLSSPNTYSFPVNVLNMETIETEWGFVDDMPIGFMKLGTLKLNLDLTDLTGANDGDADYWDVVRMAIQKGISTTSRQVDGGLAPNQYIPNRWTLYSGAGYTQKEFIGFQVFNEEKMPKIENGVITLELEINDALTTILKSIKPTNDGMNSYDLNLVAGSEYVLDVMFFDGVSYHSIINYYFHTNHNIVTYGDFWDWVLVKLNKYAVVFFRDPAILINTDITKPYTLLSSNPLSHCTFYKHNFSTSDGVPSIAIDNNTQLVLIHSIGGSDYNGLLFPHNDGGEGWDEYESLYDIIKFTVEYLHGKCIVDFNPASGTISMGFHKLYDRTLSTAEKSLNVDNIYDKYDFEIIPKIVKSVVNCKDTRNDSINEFTESIPASMSEESYELQALFQNSQTMIKDYLLHFWSNGDGTYSRAIWMQHVLAPCRNLYYINDIPYITVNGIIRIHDNCTIDLGDSITYSQTANPSYNWVDWGSSINTNAMNTGLPRVIAKMNLDLFSREHQYYFNAMVNKSLADLSMMGDTYSIDLNGFADHDFLQSGTTTDTMGLLVSIKTNHYTEISEGKWYIRSN